MSRQVVIGTVAVIVAVAAGIAIGAVVFGDDDGGEQTVASTTTTAPGTTTTGGSTTSTTAAPSTTGDVSALTGDARELADAIERADGLTYHVVFAGSTPAAEPGVTGAELTVEVWKRPPLARRDTAITAPTAELQSIELQLADERIGCFRLQSSQPFQCRPNPDPEADPGDPVFGEVDPTAGPVTARDAEVAGVAARCFAVAPAGAPPQEACFDAAGIPVVIDGGDRLERTAVDTDVTDDVFVAPA